VVAAWFAERFGEPTEPQRGGWPAIAAGDDTLLAAPTGSGKTLAAFLVAIDRLFRLAVDGRLHDQTHVLYVSPLKALANDVQKNLEQPLAEILHRAVAQGLLLPEIRAAVRTGDSLASERQALLKRPPHILVTTPESLYILLTAERSRRMLAHVQTVIVDEIHAVAGNKRGAHLTLSLERLDALVRQAGHARRPARIGLSATVRPLEEIAQFLVGSGPLEMPHAGLFAASVPSTGAPIPHVPTIVHIPPRRQLDVAVEVPRRAEMGPIATNDQWTERVERLAELAQQHRSTLVFVNTRALAERLAHRLGEQLGEEWVAAHHGSLSRKVRLQAEGRFKRGALKVMVATASLELGLDIGSVDLVCQMGSPRVISVAWQRIGRAGHWKGAIPKGRFFALTRDDLLECAAIVRAMGQGSLDPIEIPDWPRDILAQQMVATVATGEWDEDALFGMVRRAYPYRHLPRTEFDAILAILAEGISTRRGRRTAYIHRDGVHQRLRPRRGARLAAITSGGAIAETAAYTVVAEPENLTIGTLDEDFAVESHAGDIIQLGTTSWRIRGVETGRVRVESAHGQPPTIPFWRGEAPGRTLELSGEVARLRAEIAARAAAAAPDRDVVLAWLQQEAGLERLAAAQLVAYVLEGERNLGRLPTHEHLVAERFFDEAGGMQLVIHAPFGSRITKAWGLALRKRFCRGFDFELQASASENGLVLSLSEQHSFPLETIFSFLHSNTTAAVLTQAILQAPLFQTRWRWDVGRALALLRFSGGRKVPPQIQRLRSEDLLAAAFPEAVGCQDNHGGGDVELPDHPYVAEAMRDCLYEALDLAGLEAVLQGLESGAITFSAVESPAPSVLSHEILNAGPFSYLDDAPLEERRTRAVSLRRSGEVAGPAGALDVAAIRAVREEAWPEPEDADEVHDLLLSLIWLPESEAPRSWQSWLDALEHNGRAFSVHLDAKRGWVAAERWAGAQSLGIEGGPAAPASNADQETAAVRCLGGWMEILGPVTSSELAHRLGLAVACVDPALLGLEASGRVLRGSFTEPVMQDSEPQLEWCERRLLARIHRRTLNRLRAEIEPVPPAVFQRFLLRWQHLEPETRLHGAQGVSMILRQLQGFEAAAGAWESKLLPARVRDYDPEMLDLLCFSGEIAWARLSPPAAVQGDGARRLTPTRAAPFTFFRREDAAWLLQAAGWKPSDVLGRLSQAARQVMGWLEERGAVFFSDLVRLSAAGQPHLVQSQIEDALWELAAAGLVTADGFDNLRALLDPKRRRGEGAGKTARPRHSAGRWSLVRTLLNPSVGAETGADTTRDPDLATRQAQQLLRRYGVVFRALLTRESATLPWYDLLLALRRLETHGEVRGGRFVSGFAGEQYALPEALEALRATRKLAPLERPLQLSASDPLNLVGIILPGERIPAQMETTVQLGPAAEGGGAGLFQHSTSL